MTRASHHHSKVESWGNGFQLVFSTTHLWEISKGSWVSMEEKQESGGVRAGRNFSNYESREAHWDDKPLNSEDQTPSLCVDTFALKEALRVHWKTFLNQAHGQAPSVLIRTASSAWTVLPTPALIFSRSIFLHSTVATHIHLATRKETDNGAYSQHDQLDV